jgi:hypothetical protein
MLKIQHFDIIDHGIDHAQYFQGDSAMFTSFETTETGCGDTFADAIDDALEGIAQVSEVEIDFDDLNARIKESLGLKSTDEYPTKPSASEWMDAASSKGEGEGDSELYYYVSIRYSLPKVEVTK